MQFFVPLVTLHRAYVRLLRAARRDCGVQVCDRKIIESDTRE